MQVTQENLMPEEKLDIKIIMSRTNVCSLQSNVLRYENGESATRDVEPDTMSLFQFS